MAPTTTTASHSATTAAASFPSCTTAVPGKYGYVPPDACNSDYNYNPSFGAAVAFAVLFGLVFAGHLGQAIRFKKGFCWVIIMACFWELLAFIFRAMGAHDQQQLGYVIGFTLLLLLAPLWINAFIYMTLARMVHFFIPEKRVYGIKATSLTKIWVTLDIVSFIVQALGGSMLAGNPPESRAKLGMTVYMCGIGVQELFILIFVFIAHKFHTRMNELDRERMLDRSVKWRWLMYTVYAVLALITTRIVYRLCEFSQGVNLHSTILNHEYYTYVLDAIPMFFACLLLNICHPGRILQGPDSNFPKLSKQEKKALKEQKKELKLQRKEEKREIKLAKKEGRPAILPQYSGIGGAMELSSSDK